MPPTSDTRHRLDAPDIQARLELPDALWQLPAEQRGSGLWQVDGLCRLDGVGAYVGCLLPVRLAGGGTLTFGTWLAVSDADLARTGQVWGGPGYGGLRLAGTLANAVAPWGA
ncbi:MAG TPA: DUF2199 domain-containing protein, partial [Rugosimonospora sp.]|nr:DUF2199 domain-containing protein [Rugosimonospora sp.]